jgi:hypothetical protein
MPKASSTLHLPSANAQAEQRIRRELREDMTARFAYVREDIRAQGVKLDAGLTGYYRRHHTESVARQRAEAAWASVTSKSEG